jgi:hypothetical protein
LSAILLPPMQCTPLSDENMKRLWKLSPQLRIQRPEPKKLPSAKESFRVSDIRYLAARACKFWASAQGQTSLKQWNDTY